MELYKQNKENRETWEQNNQNKISNQLIMLQPATGLFMCVTAEEKISEEIIIQTEYPKQIYDE